MTELEYSCNRKQKSKLAAAFNSTAHVRCKRYALVRRC